MSTLNSHVLVLNRNFEATRVTNARVAFILLCRGVAEAIDYEKEDNTTFANYDFSTWTELSEYKSQFEKDNYRWVNLIDGVIAVPQIVRLLFSKRRPSPQRLTRKNIFARDANKCQYCGNKFSTSDLTLDHVMPSSRGGGNTWDNLVCACVKCNSKKDNKTPQEAGMKLLTVPARPTSALVLPSVSKRHWSWKHFVDEAYWNVELKD